MPIAYVLCVGLNGEEKSEEPSSSVQWRIQNSIRRAIQNSGSAIEPHWELPMNFADTSNRPMKNFSWQIAAVIFWRGLILLTNEQRAVSWLSTFCGNANQLEGFLFFSKDGPWPAWAYPESASGSVLYWNAISKVVAQIPLQDWR